MNVVSAGQGAGDTHPVPQKSWFGHPFGLSTLFFTEMWERLSYYGMRALLILYMVAPVNPLVFSEGDINNFPALVDRLKQHADPMSQFVWDNLSEVTRQNLSTYNPKVIPDKKLRAETTQKLKDALSRDLAKLMHGSSIYSEQRFSNITLSPETKDLLSRAPTGESLVRLNRLLLHDAFPEEISSIRQSGFFGFKVAKAGLIYGLYTMLVYAFGLPGGLIADRLLGQYRAIFLGGCLIVAGQFSLAFPTLGCFYGGLALIIMGTGLLKPNISSMVGSLYEPGDARRDGGFSLYYLGINVGATIAPLICGTLGQRYGWHWAFLTAGLGMIVGLVQLRFGKRHLQPAIDRIAAAKLQERKHESEAHQQLTPEERKRLAVIGVLFVFSTIFFAALEQAGTSLNLFADRMTRLSGFGYSIPSSWFQSLNPFFIIVFAPLFSWLWIALGKRQPSSPAKFVYGLILLSLGFLLIAPAAAWAQSTGAKVSPGWLIGVYLFNTLGELCLSPVGLSMVTKLAPPKLVGSIMGFWFLSNAFGNFISGQVGALFETTPLWQLFGWVFLVPFCAGLILLVLVRPLKKLMGGAD